MRATRTRTAVLPLFPTVLSFAFTMRLWLHVHVCMVGQDEVMANWLEVTAIQVKMEQDTKTFDVGALRLPVTCNPDICWELG